MFAQADKPAICVASFPRPVSPSTLIKKMLTRGRSVQLLQLREELLLKIIDSMTTTEGAGLLLCCHRLSGLVRPKVFKKRQMEVRSVHTVELDLGPAAASRRSCTSAHAPALSQAAGLVVTASADHALHVWRMDFAHRTMAWQRTLPGDPIPVIALVDNGGGRVVSAGRGFMRVWDVKSGKRLLTIRSQRARGDIVCAAALWGDRIATGHNGAGEIRLWSLQDGVEAKAGVLRGGHTDTVCSLALVGSSTAAQGLLATCSEDCSARLWDVDAGTCTAVLSGHDDAVFYVASLGGGRLISVSVDSSLRVWNTATGACLAVVQNASGADEDDVCAACALPGGSVAIASDGGTVQDWTWDEGAGALLHGAALQLEGGSVLSLAAGEPGQPPMLLAVCSPDGLLRWLDSGADGLLQLRRGEGPFQPAPYTAAGVVVMQRHGGAAGRQAAAGGAGGAGGAELSEPDVSPSRSARERRRQERRERLPSDWGRALREMAEVMEALEGMATQ